MVYNETNEGIPNKSYPDECDPIWEAENLIKVFLLNNYPDIRVLFG